MPREVFSCWLIGAGSLLAECGDVLLRRGHAVHGVITRAERVADWARSRQLTVLDPEADLATELGRRPFEHLFAIAHLALVPEALLRLPKGSAINFHDGPLPDSAGLNTPAWALIEGRTEHGVTWHEMTAGVDEGPILAEVRFGVEPDETALSLNAKCFGHALESFGGLVDALAHGGVRPRAQDLQRRRYFARRRRPRAAAVLDWTRPAAELEALVRGLAFGRYENPLGSPKLLHGGRAVIVTRALAVPVDEGEGATDAPGTLLALDERELRVATGLGSIALTELTDLSGRPLTVAAVATRLGLAAGQRLDALPAPLSRRLDELDQRLVLGEPHWVRRLAELDPVSMPLRVAARPDERAARAAALDVALPAAVTARYPGEALAAVLTAAFGVVLGRLARRDAFDLAWSDAALQRDADALTALVAARVPLRIELDRGRPLTDLAERLRAELPRLSERGGWLRDVLARHPELSTLREERDGPLLPVGVLCSPLSGAPALPDGAECTLEIDTARGACRLVYAADRIAAADAGSFAAGLAALLEDFARDPERPAGRLAVVTPQERQLQLVEWNRRERGPGRETCVHALFEEQARRTPSATALVSGERRLSYAELDASAAALAAELRARGVRREQLVGLCVERSPELVVAILGILKAGGAYVPLDPAFPTERLALMLDDSQAAVLVADARNAERLAGRAAAIVRIAPGVPAAARGPTAAPNGSRPSDLAYAIYTSGSTGRPKGVLVEHRNVTGFFAAIDAHIPHDPPGTWLAVTSPSFDISVLELLWTLTRGFEVVLPAAVARGVRAAPARTRPEFSLFYFSSDEGQDRAEGYRLLLEGARFADAHGFCAVWTPERHFHAFGGLFPNPAVAGAALAAITKRVAIRAGSVVLPLHHPIRVAEDWALVDNLSGGRVGISFASGWHPNDFVLAPQNKEDARGVMLRQLELVRRLWRGESVPFPGPGGEDIPVATLPRPVQPELPVWLTSAGNPETYVAAGRAGANVLTHLLGQSLEQLAPKLAAYRQARAEAGHDPATGVVTLMLHTFVGADEAAVAERVRAPLERYLGTSMSLVQDHAWSFPTFRRPQTAAHEGAARPDDLASLTPEDRAALLAAAGERYLGASGLIGTPERCLEVVEAARAIGVDEIACLIDFGVPADDVLASLPLLDEVRARAQAAAAAPDADASLADELRRHRVTHLQCTPSMARMLCDDPESRAALAGVRHLLVGGEVLRRELAGALRSATGGTVTNMYGPTEATIWSSTHAAGAGTGPDPIGRPLANSVFYVLDEGLEPVPIGATGELFIGGEGVARGYLRRPELDRERFLPDPFAPQPGARMYRTGDLVRCRHDGVFEFLGRTDHQIKLRGHRIETGEIESLLLRHPGVSEAVVLAEPDPAGEPRLMAYVVPNGAPADPERLRERLAEQLPEFMVPARIAVVERIPRTPVGKLDRRALAAARPAAPPATSALALPASELESRLARLWCETLGLERVGVEANFFDLGGHSLLVVRILNRMSEVTARRVALTDLFRFPTIRSLARFLSSEADPGALDEATERGRRRRERLRPGRQRLRDA